jgi:glyoxylase I family protein
MIRIEHFALYASDLEKLKTFYIDVFGLKVAIDASKAKPPGYFLIDERGAAIELIERPADSSRVNQRYVCHLAFWVDDYDGVKAEIERRGLTFELDTAVETEAMRTSFFLDPEGNRCQIVRREKRLDDRGSSSP